MERLKWTDKIKECSCATKSGRRKNNTGTDKEEQKKLAGPLAKKEPPAELCSRTGAFNLLSSRANLHLSCNPAGRSHRRLQNHEHIKHHHRGTCGSPGDVGEVSMTYTKQRNGSASFSNPSSLHLRHSSFSNPSATLPMSQLILLPFCCFTYVIGTSPSSQLMLQPFHCFTYITGHSTILLLLRLCHRHHVLRLASRPCIEE